MIKRSIFTFTALCTFGAGIVGSVGLSGCGEPVMYCLAPDGAFAAAFSTVSGDNDCLPDHGQIALDYYLGFNGEGSNSIADPTQAKLSFVMVSARSQVDAALAHIKKLKLYETCANKDPAVNTNFDPNTITSQAFWSMGPYTNANPDANDQCSVDTLSEATLVIPEMPAIPACKDDAKSLDIKESPAFAAVNIKYKAAKLTAQVSPAFQGLYAFGDFTYSGQKADGTDCSGTYRFEAINPVESCLSDQECVDKQTGTATKSPKILIKDPLRCAGFKPAEGDKDAVPGICVLRPK